MVTSAHSQLEGMPFDLMGIGAGMARMWRCKGERFGAIPSAILDAMIQRDSVAGWNKRGGVPSAYFPMAPQRWSVSSNESRHPRQITPKKQHPKNSKKARAEWWYLVGSSLDCLHTPNTQLPGPRRPTE